MKLATKLIAACALWTGATAVFSQNVPYPPPQNVLQLTASGTVEVQQDLLSLQLGTTREGADATAVQAVGSSRVDLQACKLEYSIVSPK